MVSRLLRPHLSIFPLKSTSLSFVPPLLYAGGLMIFFWALFDGIVSYISPLLITHGGYSKTALGFLLGSSSVAGALFDYLLSRYLKNPHYRGVYLMMFAACAAL